MRIYGVRFTLIAALLALTLALTLAAWSGSANQNSNPQKASKQEITPQNDIPVLDIKQAETTGSDQLKGRKHRQGLRQIIPIAELPTNIEPLSSSAHGLFQVSAMPVKESDAIILGKVTDRRAVLTEDKLDIYSEFSIEIAEIFKDDPNLFRVGQVVTVFRPGGVVRFPSGRVQRYTVDWQGYPQQGKVYVLFLKRDEEGDFSILTGYEIEGTLIQPLDGRRGSTKKEERTRFDTYRGVSRETFIDALQKALQKAGGGQD